MSKIQIAWLEWMTVGGIGGVLILAGTAIHLVKKGKNKSCTQQTKGCVVRYGFPGDGRMYPIVEYAVDGICYRARKEFCGVKTRKQSGFPMRGQAKAYEDEKGWLHIQRGAIADLRLLAEGLWPMGSQMTVYYDPNDPKRSYVDRPISGGFVSMMFVIMGAAAIAIGGLTFFLIQL